MYDQRTAVRSLLRVPTGSPVLVAGAEPKETANQLSSAVAVPARPLLCRVAAII